jgi:uncharacterized protein (TIGR03435 family)
VSTNSPGTGTFDFSIEWVLPRDPAQPPAIGAEDVEPTFLQALEEQLGLSLKTTRAPIPVLVVDRIQRPLPN